MINYRSFRNTDPPLIAKLWNACLGGTRIAMVLPHSTLLLEFFLFSKLYFDPAGLILAFDEDQPVGFVHAGFGPTADRADIDPTMGVICYLGVLPSHRRQGIGSELLRRAETYLRSKGSTQILAGPMGTNNPFTFGIYGGCDSPGFLSTHPEVSPFFARQPYQLDKECGLFQRKLADLRIQGDSRFFDLRQQCEISFSPFHRAGWYRELALGPVEVVEYRIQNKATGEILGRSLLWMMEVFSHQWNLVCVGILDLQVVPDHRKKGVAKFLLTQILRYLQDQRFDLIEAMCELDNSAGVNLLQSMGFNQVATGQCYRRS